MENMYIAVSRILLDCSLVTYFFSIQDYENAFIFYNKLLLKLSSIIDILVKNEYKTDLFENTLSPALSKLYEIQKTKNHILLSDTLQLELVPMFTNILDSLEIDMNKSPEEIWNFNYDNNIKFIKERDIEENKSLLLQLEKLDYRNNIEFAMSFSNIGYPTLFNNKDATLIHSKFNPSLNDYVLARKYLDDDTRRFVIFGGGLGYLYNAISFYSAQSRVDVYESNIQIFYHLILLNDLRDWEDRNIYIHFDPECNRFMHDIKTNNSTLIMYYPTIKFIDNIEMKNMLAELYIKNESYYSKKNEMIINFNNNVNNYFKNVSLLQKIIKDKRVFIIAAGPSLDKNLHYLKEHPENSIIIAVGTVAKKVISLGIPIDYLLISDPKSTIWRQIEPIVKYKIPIICLSTACYKIGELYEADKYIVYQKGYQKAENKAFNESEKLYQTGGSVSTLALDVARQLGARDVVFIGLDLAYSNGYLHCTDTITQISLNEYETIKTQSYDGISETYTDIKLNIYRKWFEDYIKRMKNDNLKTITVYNATEGGAYINGMENAPLNNLIK